MKWKGTVVDIDNLLSRRRFISIFEARYFNVSSCHDSYNHQLKPIKSKFIIVIKNTVLLFSLNYGKSDFYKTKWLNNYF